MDINQIIIVLSLLLTLVFWVTGIIKKSYASIFLLLMFSIFGRTPLRKIFTFPLSPNFLLITFSFIFSQGIANSKLTEKLFQPFITKYARNQYQILLSILLTVTTLAFIIPQPFSRVIIIAYMYYEYFQSINLDKKAQEVLLFAIFAFTLLAQMLSIRGDIIMNNGLLAIAGVNMSEFQWMKYLMVPGIFMTISGAILFALVFRKELLSFKPGEIRKEKVNLTKDDKINLSLILLVVFLWATESVHNISGTLVVVIGTVLMYFRNLVDFGDVKSINVEILFFLTASFSIGAVMSGSGVADIIFGKFTGLFPAEFSNLYVFIMILTTMVLHMILGSSVTTISVVVPGLITISKGLVDTKILMFVVFLSVVSHYILPFHNALLVVGEGNGYYTSKTMSKYGLYLTFLTLISIFLFFIPWWKLLNLF